MDIKSLSQKYSDYMIEQRRYFHAHPELSGEEFETTKYIKQQFIDMGITDISELKTKNGFVAKLHGGKPGKCIGLRTDTDALPIQEETDLPFASKVQGKMHACGHDNHIAILLGAAKILNEIKDELDGDVKFIIQPAEELAIGATWIIDEGLVDDCDAFYGSHVWSCFDQPFIDCSRGNKMACCHVFKIAVDGLSSQNDIPHLGVDAITISSSIIKNLQQICSRQNDPSNPLVITIGTINGGDNNKLICDHVEMDGTVRTFISGTQIEEKMRKIIEGTATSLGGNAKLYDYQYMTEPVINDNKLGDYVESAINTICGEECLYHDGPVMGSEDFSFYGTKTGKPYFFSFIGSRNPEKGLIYSNHHEKYTVDEDIIHNGAAVMAQFAINYLSNEK